MIAFLDDIAGWLQENLLVPMLYQLGLMQWEDMALGWALFAVYGAVQVMLTLAVCMPLEAWRPVEKWENNQAVLVDIFYTCLSRIGILPLISFVLFWQVQTALNGFLTDQGWVAPTRLRRILAPSPVAYVPLVVGAAFAASRANANDLLVR
jgi:sterol desaturase/sphingolipid hydroxylase (fatty acid hydroxylase superfamily)